MNNLVLSPLFYLAVAAFGLSLQNYTQQPWAGGQCPFPTPKVHQKYCALCVRSFCLIICPALCPPGIMKGRAGVLSKNLNGSGSRRCLTDCHLSPLTVHVGNSGRFLTENSVSTDSPLKPPICPLFPHFSLKLH